MKIIAKDNYDRETVSDRLICENIDKHIGERMVNFLNENGRSQFDFFVLVEDDYKLYKFEP